MLGVISFVFIWAGLLTGAFATSYAPQKDQNPLDKFRWQKRVLLLFRPAASDPAGATQLNLLKKVPDDLAERDLEVVVITGDHVEHPKLEPTIGAALRRQFKISPTAFNLVLIGKDGGEKYRTRKAEDPAVIFNVIDAMPMRQSEINQQKKRL